MKKEQAIDFGKLNVPAINIAGYDHVAHLSYVDLDGFACSTIIHEARQGNVWQMNVEDKADVDKAIEELIAKGKNHEEGTLLILITDIYVNKEQSVQLDAINIGKVDVRVIPTHDIEDNAVEEYPEWYYQNAGAASASAILYEAVVESATDHISYLEGFVKVVSAYDMLDTTDLNLFNSGSVINDGLNIYLGKPNKDDDYTRDIAVKYLAEISKVVEGGICDSTSTDVDFSIEAAWRHAVGCTDEDTVIDVIVRNLATRVLEDRSNRYEVELDDVVYRCAIVGALPFDSAVPHDVLAFNTCDVDFVVSFDKESRFGFVYSKDGDDAIKLFHRHFDVSDIADELIHGDIYSVLEEIDGFVKVR